MTNLTAALEYIINDFNADCSNESKREKITKRVLEVRNAMIGIKNNQGVIVAACKKSRADLEGDRHHITISASHYHCTCKAHLTSKRDEMNHKKPCKHIVFVASATAIYLAKGGE